MDVTHLCKNSSLTLEASGRMCEEPTVISKHLYNDNGRRVILPPTGSPTGDSFISGMSIIMLLYFFLMLRSSASPFLNPRVSSIFVNILVFFALDSSHFYYRVKHE